MRFQLYFSAPRSLPLALCPSNSNSIPDAVFVPQNPVPFFSNELNAAASFMSLPANMSSTPTYLTGDKEGIKAFLDKFEACPTSTPKTGLADVV
jgi:hypothetical protein